MGPEDSPDAVAEAAAIAAGEEALKPPDRATEQSVDEQMRVMQQRDRIMAWACVVAMLIVLPFVLIAVWSAMPSAGVRIVVVAACAVVLTYNVASMLALVRNYARDREFIYRRDVAHLRERAALRAAKARQ